MSPADRIAWLAIYGVTVTVTDDKRLAVTGPATIVDAAGPALRMHRAAIIAHLLQDGRNGQ